MIPIHSSDEQPYECCQSCYHRGTSECVLCDDGDRYEFDPETEEAIAA